ncbi:ATP-binding region ATPase domain protein [Clostridium cellulovorans 743B]|uniref:ATP-binding region ATPase domain protein n=1 Tax=Clostridium cellulovorans (strain ATCC 35296 / DSM 3052 / OCM 3 / 743B) TaxID=573061 RepID=D9SSM8_CLOC7|nr:ATP-binding region ATPase domain protein [Clostridium cellulovorans 743B]
MYYTIATTLAQTYLIYTFSDKKINIKLKGVFAIIVVMLIKPRGMLFLADNLLSFIFVWFCNYIIAYFCIGKNFRRNLQLSFFVELITLMSYYMSSGIVLILGYNITITDIFNFNILIHPIDYSFILIYLVILLAFGLFRRYIPLTFPEDNVDRRNFNGIYIIILINVLIKIINDLNINYGIKLISFVSINFFILMFYIINNKLDIKNIKDELELNEKEKKIKELTLYIETIEELVEKYREFKHDYKNIVIGMGIDSLKENDLLDKLSMEVVGDKSYDAFLNLKDINYIPLKSILSYYIMLSIKEDVKVSLVAIGEIKECHISEVEFSRVMGIILENALEETLRCDDKKLEVYVEAINSDLNITVANTFKREELNVDKIYNKGYSTKGENRGLGLYILKSIVDKNFNMTLNTFINEGMFTQDLYIFSAKKKLKGN